MEGDIAFTLIVVGAVFVALAANIGAPDLLFLAATTMFAVGGVITVEEAFSGFANPAMLTVGALFVVAAGLRDTGILDFAGRRILGNAKTSGAALNRLGAVVTTMSAFLNNTPVVAMFMPIVIDWSRRNRVSPSKLLIPLSYFAIVGGVCTLIGTSTNLVVDGLMGEAGLPRIGLFEITPVGLACAAAGLAYLYLIGQRLLPERKELLEQLGESRREFLSEMMIEPPCRLIGQTVEQAGLRQLPGAFLIEIVRAADNAVISPVTPDTMLRAGDRLVFTGIVSSIIEMERIPGLNPVADPAYEVSPRAQQQRRLVEAVISNVSPLIGKTIRDADFRARFGAAVIAVHRGGERVKQKVGDIELESGDTLLLQTQPHFLRAYRNDPSFYLVSDVEEWRPLRHDRAWISLAIFVALIGMMVYQDSKTLLWAMLAGLALIATGCISATEARKSVEWQALVMIGASFGVGAALDNSGAAKYVAEMLVGATQQLGPIWGLAGMYLMTVIVTEIISNNAAAVLMFPFAVETARLFDANPRTFIMAVLFGASAGFMTPIGYQTHMMVYGPGGYRFADFMRVGAGMHLALFPVVMTLIPRVWPFH